MNQLLRLIEDRSDVLWLIKLRNLDPRYKFEVIDSMCPMRVDRIQRTFFSYNTQDLHEELIELNEAINNHLESVSLHQIADLL